MGGGGFAGVKGMKEEVLLEVVKEREAEDLLRKWLRLSSCLFLCAASRAFSVCLSICLSFYLYFYFFHYLIFL